MTSSKAGTADTPYPTGENFADLLDETFGTNGAAEGSVLKGTVIAIEKVK